ncbi:MAG TPA: helix-turn-helix domain-containing protein, partial [Candidatus Paceibacterota bacterium]|nr:helix-turn-helix domain-containing protein [Verrucomicrobiota bacterium]HSA12606.1 helix-turn-helix domain-containing protein [Candidatus Paceibacterota bacterium]
MSRLFTLADLERLAVELKFDLDGLAARCGVSLRQFQRLFKAQHSQCPRDWMREMKCRIAAELIRQGYRTSEAAREAGFASPALPPKKWTPDLGSERKAT